MNSPTRFGWSRVAGLLSINLELTNHCNLKCTFCPTGNSLMVRPRGFMDPALFARTLREAGPLEFVLLFQWGEPLMHPQFAALAKQQATTGRGRSSLPTRRCLTTSALRTSSMRASIA